MELPTDILGGVKGKMRTYKVGKKEKRRLSKTIERARTSSIARKLSMKRSGTYNASGRKIKRSSSNKTSYTIRPNGDIVKHDMKMGKSYYIRRAPRN
jgi:hypothetical protein